jgi:hypothetical protein
VEIIMMKNMLAKVGLFTMATLVGTGIYVMNNDKAKKCAKKKITKAMGDAENVIAKM